MVHASIDNSAYHTHPRTEALSHIYLKMWQARSKRFDMCLETTINDMNFTTGFVSLVWYPEGYLGFFRYRGCSHWDHVVTHSQ